MKYLFGILFLIVAAGCSPTNGSSGSTDNGYSSPPPYVPSTQTPSDTTKDVTKDENYFDWHDDIFRSFGNSYEDEFTIASEIAFNKQFVTCDGNCSNGIGLLLNSNLNREVDACTAFLVDHDVVMTASHCVPDDLKTSGSSATGRIQIKFPVTNETLNVDHVMFASDLSDKKTRFEQDYALLKLTERSYGSPLKLSRSGILEGSSVKIWRVGPGAYGSQLLSETTCRAVQNTNLFPEYRNDRSPISVLSDCSIFHGNSGSPVLNDRDEVVGVLDAYFNILETPVGGTMSAQDIEAIPRIAMVTTLSCIKDFNKNPMKLSDACNEDMSGKAYFDQFGAHYRTALGLSGAEVDAQVRQQMQDWQSQNSKVFRWKFKLLSTYKSQYKEVNDHPSYDADIDCIQPIAQWIGDYKSFHYFNKSKATVSGGYYSFGAGVGADSTFKLHPQARVISLGTYSIDFDPAEIMKTGVAHVSFTQNMEIFGTKFGIPFPRTVSMCQ